MENIRTWFVNALIIIGAFWGGYQYMEAHYASASEVSQIKEELHAKIRTDKAFQIRERLWKLEDKYPGISKGKAPREVLDIYRQMKTELEGLEKSK